MTNRRDFFKGAAIAGITAGTAFLSERRIAAAGDSVFKRMVYRDLGSTGYKTTEVGFGAMNTRDPELIEAAIDSGINYLDTANSYMNGVNEEIIGRIMKTKRDKVFLTTKVKYDNSNVDIKDMPKMIEESLKRLQTDHVDLLLLHICDKREQVLRPDLIKVLGDAREKGFTRFVGVSTHANQAEVLDAAVESKFWQAVLVGYSYFSPSNVTESIKKARLAGLAIIGMKNLLNTEKRPRVPYPDIRLDGDTRMTEKQALYKWVLNNPYIDTIIPGMTSFEQLEDDIALMSMKGFSTDFKEDIKLGYDSGRCRSVAGCTGCLDKCPKGVRVQDINRCLGYAFSYGDKELAMSNYMDIPRSGRLDVCDDCDVCHVKCVNGIDLIDNIHMAKALFG